MRRNVYAAIVKQDVVIQSLYSFEQNQLIFYGKMIVGSILWQEPNRRVGQQALYWHYPSQQMCHC